MDREAYQKWLWEKLGERCMARLKDHGFDPHVVGSVAEARDLVLGLAGPYGTVALPGSDTTRALGLATALAERGKTVYDHWKQGLSREEDLQIRLQQGRADCAILSANAISATGEIVNVDGMGNRVNAMTFGCKKVIVVAGMNKVAPDLEGAIRRVREVAGPMRAKSLNMKTPCAETGVCSDCNAPQRICRVTTILHRRPMLTDVSVVLVTEALGF